jgi:hypothetical protein
VRGQCPRPSLRLLMQEGFGRRDPFPPSLKTDRCLYLGTPRRRRVSRTPRSMVSLLAGTATTGCSRAPASRDVDSFGSFRVRFAGVCG